MYVCMVVWLVGSFGGGLTRWLFGCWLCGWLWVGGSVGWWGGGVVVGGVWGGGGVGGGCEGERGRCGREGRN